jgi:hypothetical protein
VFNPLHFHWSFPTHFVAPGAAPPLQTLPPLFTVGIVVGVTPAAVFIVVVVAVAPEVVVPEGQQYA